LLQNRMSHAETVADDVPVVSIILPCLNEAETLEACIRNANEALAAIAGEFGLRGEIVVADNGSTDGSCELAEWLGVRVIHVLQRGYGCALRSGCLAAVGRFLIIGDADGSYDFCDSIPMVRDLLAGYDLCMGSRFKGHIMPGAMPWKNRYIGNPALSGLLNLFFQSGMSDAHCGLRAFTSEAFGRLRLSATGMEFASEVVVKSSLLRLRCSEVPITLHRDQRNRAPHLRPWRDGWRHLRYLLMLSPEFLFVAPALAMGSISAALLLMLVLTNDSSMVRVGPFQFGDHWAIASGAAMIASAQVAFFGIATTLYGVREGFRTLDPWLARLFSCLRLEHMILTGILLGVLGLGLMVHVGSVWTAHDFGGLARVRETVAAAVSVILGLQAFFGGFFLAIVNGNDTSLIVTAPEHLTAASESRRYVGGTTASRKPPSV
jgi:glycosyltransferase involved in cell wall biosynthesis